jgi:hypothetical protein
MMLKPLDPNTVTLEQLAQAYRSDRIAHWVGVAVGVGVAVVAGTIILSNDFGGSPFAAGGTFLAGCLGYRLTFEALCRVLPPH